MAYLKEIIPAGRLEEYQKETEQMVKELKKYSGTWVEKYPLIKKLVIWYYERKFLKAIKRLTDGIKHS